MSTITYNTKTLSLPKGVSFKGWDGRMAVFLYSHPFTRRLFQIIELDAGFHVSEGIPDGTRTIVQADGSKYVVAEPKVTHLMGSPNAFRAAMAQQGIIAINYLDKGMRVGTERFASLAECKTAIDARVARDEWWLDQRTMDEAEQANYKRIDAMHRLWLAQRLKATADHWGYGGEHWTSGIMTFGRMKDGDPRRQQLDAYLAEPSAAAWDDLRPMHIAVIGTFGEAWARSGQVGFPTAEQLQEAVRAYVRSEYAKYVETIERLEKLLAA